MELSTILGLLLGFGAMAIAAGLEGSDLHGFISESAALIVFGGTLGATLTSYPLSEVLKLPKLIMQAFRPGSIGLALPALVDLFVELAERARREGLLSLEDEAGKIQDPFLKKGVLLVVDGIDPDVVREILDVDITAMEERHQRSYGMLESMGGYAPTMGIIGTVMGLIHVLGNLDDPSQLGPAIAVAFIATLYGVASANLIWLPLGSKLKSQTKEEVRLREVGREGILSVQAGDNPRIVREKLEAYLSRRERASQASVGADAEATMDRGGSPMAAGSTM